MRTKITPLPSLLLPRSDFHFEVFVAKIRHFANLKKKKKGPKQRDQENLFLENSQRTHPILRKKVVMKLSRFFEGFGQIFSF